MIAWYTHLVYMICNYNSFTPHQIPLLVLLSPTWYIFPRVIKIGLITNTSQTLIKIHYSMML